MRYDAIESAWDERRLALFWKMKHAGAAVWCDRTGDPIHAALERHAAEGAGDVAAEAEARALFLGSVRA